MHQMILLFQHVTYQMLNVKRGGEVEVETAETVLKIK